jgi:transposase
MAKKKAARIFWLSDLHWAVLEPMLPKQHQGPEREDDRRIISGILYVLNSGCRWKDCPPEYGPYTTIYNRFRRWSERGLWQKILSTLTETVSSFDTYAIDSTTVKAHRSVNGHKKGVRIRLLA